ncbi:MAG TPA: diguanylate cyclase [Pyrinomonadaceae bacterium]|nr:diguanylate cyclase [Pyrinomonadaceae bacterium]
MPEELDSVEIDSFADKANESGLAIAIVDDGGERFVANNNSICRTLNSAGKFSPACAEFCGRAFANARSAGSDISYKCHAGLECQATPIAGPEPLVAIVGRAFLKNENYRQARLRAISGDWAVHLPLALFESVHVANAPDSLDHLIAAVKQMTLKEETIAAAVEPHELDRAPSGDSSAVPIERRKADAAAWRSFFGSLLRSSYADATHSILSFIAAQYGLSALVWLENRGGRFESTAGFGSMRSRGLRLAVTANDPRLLEAIRTHRPLELSEGASGTRRLNLFPVGMAGEVSAALAVLDPIMDDAVKGQIARRARSLGPPLEIVNLRSRVEISDSQSTLARKFGSILKRIDDDDLWLRVTQHAAEMLRAERASLLVFDEAKDGLAIKAIIGARSQPAEGEEIGERVAKHVFMAGEAFAVADVAATGLEPKPERGYKTESFMSYPVSLGGRSLGVMSFTDRLAGAAFDARSLDMFEAIAPLLAVAIDRTILKEKAGKFEQLSVTDALTGLLNRRYMEARLLEETKRSNRHGFPMSFMVLDVDHFKSYNDEFGHPAGDEALKLVAKVLRDTLRAADVAARFGGEEFSILLPQTTREEAAAIGERLRANIERAAFEHRPVTASIGVASCSAELCLSADLVLAADQALYEAKRRGRNRVVAFKDVVQMAARRDKE